MIWIVISIILVNLGTLREDRSVTNVSEDQIKIKTKMASSVHRVAIKSFSCSKKLQKLQNHLWAINKSQVRFHSRNQVCIFKIAFFSNKSKIIARLRVQTNWEETYTIDKFHLTGYCKTPKAYSQCLYKIELLTALLQQVWQ